jgi:hypothetical protein
MKIMNLQATFEARAASKRAYETIQKICEKANAEVDAFVKQQIDFFIVQHFELEDPEEAFQYYSFVSNKSGENIEEYFLMKDEEEIFIFRIRKVSEKKGDKVVVSHMYEL